MKVLRPLHAFLGILLIGCCFLSFGLFAAEAGSERFDEMRLLLLSSELSSATYHELYERAVFLGLSDEGDDTELRQRLYAHYGLNQIQPEVPPLVDEKDFQVHVISSDRMYLSEGMEGILLLEGAVNLRFSIAEESETTELEADRIVFHFQKKLLTAMGSVSYDRGGSDTEDILHGSMVTIGWENGSLWLRDGRTSMVRKNSEEESVEFFTTGEEVVFTEDPRSIAFHHGMVTTNLEQAYFSIRSKSLHLVDGGDMFVTNATISLGRVPMLWVPFLYYPGKTFVFNPAFGFDSERGLFFSSSTELYGRYPKIEKGKQSSFTTLLSGENPSGELKKDGWVYTDMDQAAESSSLERWATKSGSYFTVLLDAYQTYGMFLGFDTDNRFVSDTYRISAFGGVGFAGSNTASVSTVYDIPPLRYAFDGNVVIDTAAVDLSLHMPMYSDPKVMRTYGNRLTSFSLSALTGNPAFPTSYRSDITGYDWDLRSRIVFPTAWVTPHIHTLRIDKLDAKVSWVANDSIDGPGYAISSFVLPDLQVYAAGTIFSHTWDAKERSTTEEEVLQRTPWEPVLVPQAWGIDSPYRVVEPSIDRNAAVDTSSVSLGYIARQYFTESNRVVSQVVEDSSRYARSAGTLLFDVKVAPSLLTLKQSLDPVFTVDESKGIDTQRGSFASSTHATLPSINLSYDLKATWYQAKRITSDTDPTVEEGGWISWGPESVSTHQLSWIDSYNFLHGKISPSLVTTLAPLPYGFRPKLSFKAGRVLTSIAYLVEEQASGGFVGKDATFTFSYTDKARFEFASTMTYDTEAAYTVSDPLDALDVSSSMVIHLFDSYVRLHGESEYQFFDDAFSQFVLGASVPWASIDLQGSGSLADPVFDLLDAQVTVDAFEQKWWKNRISLGFSISSSYRHAFWDAAASQFTMKMDLHFKIEEFLTLDFALKSVNKGFHRYDTFQDVWLDLLDSFDFLGDGRQKTQFTMEAFEISLIHHMADWDLHCKYEGSVVLSDMEWQWKPVFSVFLQWKAIPEIKVDREFDARTW